MIIRHLILLAAMSPFAAFGAEKVSNFQTATYTEVVKDVSTVSGNSGKLAPAKSGESFTNEDLVKSGRGSRAQLTVPDGTIIRVGPNAVFSLDKTTRTVKLESGSILFYTPPGAGGGNIVTDSVTCAVTGTTVGVTKDPVTGLTTVQLLEGHANVIRTADGASVSIAGGQGIHINPKVLTPLVTFTFTPASFPSPILFSGFTSSLPSLPKIVDSIGGVPQASPAVIASGADGGLTNNGAGIPSTSVASTTTPGSTSTPAAQGQPVIPNVAQTSGTFNPTNPSQPISPNGEGQTN